MRMSNFKYFKITISFFRKKEKLGKMEPLQLKHKQMVLNSRNFTFYLLPPTKVYDRDIAVQMFDGKEWTDGKARSAISFIVNAQTPNYGALFIIILCS